MEYKDALKLADAVPGSLIELGFGKGNSLKEFISYMNNIEINKRNIWIYESFDGYNEPTPEDNQAFKKGDFKRPPQPAYDIKNTINTKVELVKGYIEETLPTRYDKSSVSILHSHLISYSSTLHGLENFEKYMPPGSVIVVTDYQTFDGTKQAVDEFLTKHSPKFKTVEVNDTFIVIQTQKVQRLSNKVSRTRSEF
ncbi:TylF/MycF family methyltransferase [bacterium]|nr:TylF/MycF family methyltransferase [bacterium]